MQGLRDAEGNDQSMLLGVGTPIHIKAPHPKDTASLVLGILIPLCMLVLSIVAFYVIRRRRSGKFNVR